MAPNHRFSVCLLASHPLVLSEFQRLLSRASVRVEAKQLPPILLDAVKLPRASVYLVDRNGSQAATETLVGNIFDRFATARILVVDEQFSESSALALLSLGIKGLLQHSQLSEQLERAVQSIASGNYWVPRALLTRFIETVHASRPHGTRISARAGLSRREMEVVRGVLDNLSNKEIGSKLNISERTVKFHVSNLLQKLNVRRRADLIVLAYQESWRVPNS